VNLPHTVLVLDDHPLMLGAMEIALSAVAPQATVHTASTLRAAMDLAALHSFDFAIVDLGLPDSTGMSVLQRFRQAAPDLPVVVFSASSDRETIMDSLGAGAMGFIPKTSPSDVMLNALRLVFSGSIYVPHEALAGRDVPVQIGPDLTPRQMEVMQMLLLGLSNKRICRQLGISENTVKVHMTAVLRGLGAENRTQAVLNAAQLGIRVPRVSASPQG
jgi:DNA-binding NarL/FixJ family response regulator